MYALPAPDLWFAFLAGFLAALLAFALIGRTPRVLAPLARILAHPLRPLRRFRRRSRLTSAAAEGAVVADRGLGYRTAVDHALELDAEAQAREPVLSRSGLVFHAVSVPEDWLPPHLVGHLTPEIEAFYVAEADRFFSTRVNLDADPKSLYEDEEGAHIVDMFKAVDRRCFLALNEMRKTINGNMLSLILVLTAILVIWSAFAIWQLWMILGAPAEANLRLLQAGGVWALVLAAFFIIHNNGYRQQQQISSREMRLLLVQYLDRIADRYRQTIGDAKQVTVGDQTDPQELAEQARRRHKVMLWIPFRTFFIEVFVRGILYQINRNCGYYLWIPNIVAVLVIGALAAATYLAMGGQSPAVLASGGFWLSFGSLTMMLASALFFYFERIHTVVLAKELTHLNWIGYGDLNVGEAMDEVVGKYAEDIGYWKRRLPRV